MTRAAKANLAASVAARLLDRARETGDAYQTLLTSYCLERFLYRLSVSDRRTRFVLKGNGNGGKAKADISIYSQELNYTAWRLAKMNLVTRPSYIYGGRNEGLAETLSKAKNTRRRRPGRGGHPPVEARQGAAALSRRAAQGLGPDHRRAPHRLGEAIPVPSLARRPTSSGSPVRPTLPTPSTVSVSRHWGCDVSWGGS